MKRLRLLSNDVKTLPNAKPQTNDDLVETKIFTYELQVENTLATMVRNGLLSIRIAFLFYLSPRASPWIGRLMMFVGATVIMWSTLMYTRNITLVRRLTHSTENKQTWNAYIWPILCMLFSICIYAGAFELL